MDHLTSRQRDAWLAICACRVEVPDSRLEPHNDIIGIRDQVKKKPVKVGTVDMVVWGTVVMGHGPPLGIPHLLSRTV
jgi:hypothetical protein